MSGGVADSEDKSGNADTSEFPTELNATKPQESLIDTEKDKKETEGLRLQIDSKGGKGEKRGIRTAEVSKSPGQVSALGGKDGKVGIETDPGSKDLKQPTHSGRNKEISSQSGSEQIEYQRSSKGTTSTETKDPPIGTDSDQGEEGVAQVTDAVKDSRESEFTSPEVQGQMNVTDSIATDSTEVKRQLNKTKYIPADSAEVKRQLIVRQKIFPQIP